MGQGRAEERKMWVKEGQKRGRCGSRKGRREEDVGEERGQERKMWVKEGQKYHHYHFKIDCDRRKHITTNYIRAYSLIHLD